MRTNDLIAMLSTNVKRVDRRQLVRTLGIAVLIGAMAAFAVMLLALGVRNDLPNPSAIAYLPIKILFTLGTLVVTSVALSKLARPGGEKRVSIALVALPFIGIMLFAGLSLASAPSSHWDRMILGDNWLECVLSIPLIAIVPFAAIIWAVRQTAPTDLVRAGALAGMVAGGVSATAYALHCTDDSLPFIALWYGGTIALCTGAGALLGPRLLRW